MKSMAKLLVEVLYAPPGAVDRVELHLDDGATARDALRASGLLARHPELDSGIVALGIYGRVVAPEQPLTDGDRVEVYRPLIADPKEARRRRASRKS